MTEIEPLTDARAKEHLPQLVELLVDTVEGGAAVGFLPPLPRDEAEAYWLEVIEDISAGSRILLAALLEGQVVGSVQLELAKKSNGRHRAEVQKLMVHQGYRGQGIAGELLDAVEEAARGAARTLLVLDTRRGDTAHRLYPKFGWIEAGIIPQFAFSADGTLHDTVVFYKLLVPA